MQVLPGGGEKCGIHLEQKKRRQNVDTGYGREALTDCRGTEIYALMKLPTLEDRAYFISVQNIQDTAQTVSIVLNTQRCWQCLEAERAHD